MTMLLSFISLVLYCNFLMWLALLGIERGREKDRERVKVRECWKESGRGRETKKIETQK